ncbi:MAG: hypothetical protein AMXMBFR7_33870 [Planctomycetota bacterium]
MTCSLFIYAALLACFDLYLLVQIGREFGLAPALAIAFLPSVLGGGIAQRQRARVWSRMQDDLKAGRPLDQSLTEGIVAMAAGVLLVIPGPVSTVLGLLLLIPGLRRLAARSLQRRMGARLAQGRTVPGAVDATFRTVDADSSEASQPFAGGYVKVVRLDGAGPASGGGIKEAQGRTLDDDEEAPPALPAEDPKG